ncbi:MAG: CopD family protein [Acetobacteraceae bacterium]|nr:CopD family protein [Acetobacteraceae bacterium]
MSFLSVLKAIHILGVVAWVGGMAFAYLVLRPSLAVLEPPQRMLLHAQVFKRFFLIVWHAMPLIVLTGFGMVFGYYGGMAHVDWNIHVMLLLGLVMAAIFAGIVFGPYKTFKTTSDRSAMAAAADSIRRMIALNLVLGVVTVVVAVLVLE